MKIVFNTTQPHAPCSTMYSDALRGIEEITLYDNRLELYDIALFMTYDYEFIKPIREKFPKLKIGLLDPRSYRVFDSTQYCDFLVIDSIEMQDYWRCAGKPLFEYVEYPNINTVEKTHEDKDKFIIGYHGNKIHLECMSHNVTPALTKLREKYNIELMVMYNGKAPSGKEEWCPKNVPIRHIPWSMENYHKYLSKCDIGIVPNNLIHDSSVKRESATKSNFNYSDDDYSIRFKMPSNPGRSIIFGKLGIPVVADFYPSAIRLLQEDVGYVAHNSSGWIYCLERLISSRELRQSMGDSFQKLVNDKYNFATQNNKFLDFLRTI